MATLKQIAYGEALGLKLKTKSFRVAEAMISDEVEKRCWDSIEKQGLEKGDKVIYTGNYPGRKNKTFIINSVGKYGLIHFFIIDEFGNKKHTYANATNIKKITVDNKR